MEGFLSSKKFVLSNKLVSKLKEEEDDLPSDEENDNEHEMHLSKLKNWIRTQPNLNCRTDDEFLLIFLRGCKFDEQKVKKKLRMYYENRVRLPKWWANRDLHQLEPIAQRNVTVCLMDRCENEPTLTISKVSRLGPDGSQFDDYAKFHAVIMEVVLRRKSAQKSGQVWIIDCRDYPSWLQTNLLFIRVLFNVFKSYWLAMPVKLVAIYALYTPTIARRVYDVLHFILTKKMQSRIFMCDDSWPQMIKNIPAERLPVEYGGQLTDMKTHEDEFVNEIMSYAEYMAEDDKFGFQKKKKLSLKSLRTATSK